MQTKAEWIGSNNVTPEQAARDGFRMTPEEVAELERGVAEEYATVRDYVFSFIDEGALPEHLEEILLDWDYSPADLDFMRASQTDKLKIAK